MPKDQEQTKAALESEIRLLRQNIALLRKQQEVLSHSYLKTLDVSFVAGDDDGGAGGSE